MVGCGGPGRGTVRCGGMIGTVPAVFAWSTTTSSSSSRGEGPSSPPSSSPTSPKSPKGSPTSSSKSVEGDLAPAGLTSAGSGASKKDGLSSKLELLNNLDYGEGVLTLVQGEMVLPQVAAAAAAAQGKKGYYQGQYCLTT